MTQANNRHIIKKQVFEVEVVGEAKAQEVQNKLGAIFQSKVLPLLNETLNKLSPPNVLHRIERLEIDLGQLRLSHLEEDIAQQVKTVLAKSLQSSIAEVDATPSAKALEQLQVQEVMPKLKLALRAILNERLPGDDSLDTLLARIKAVDLGLGREHQAMVDKLKASLIGLLKAKGSLNNVVDSAEALLDQAQNAVAVQQSSNKTRGATSEIWTFFMETGRLPWWAQASSNLLENALLATLEQHSEWLLAQLNKYYQSSNTRQRLITTFSNEVLLKISEHYTNAQALLDLVQVLQKNLPSIAQGLKGNLARTRYFFWELVLLTLAEATPPKPTLFLQNFVWSLAQNSQPSRKATEVTQLLMKVAPVKVHNVAVDWEVIWADNNDEPATKDRAKPVPKNANNEPISPPLQKQFSASEELYIDNAGLVILWVFLSNFFKNLKWVEDKKFKTVDLQHRAAWMLQYLVDGGVEPPEYVLPLNKLLCGIPINQALEPQLPLTEEEQADADLLMEAVLEYTKGLGSISEEGFRQSFLQREGVITPQNNGYLLQVEKETFDILLTRLEWSYQVVKLPWMPKAIFVEW